MSVRLFVLLPVRNGESDLPGFFESVSRFADGVVALDDGSTDRTAELLANEPLVKRVLSNPQREDYRAWNDSENRQRLLEAVAEFAPDWILSLDADERLDPDDGAALRRFIEEEALAGCAYGFKVLRMWGDEQHFSRSGLWVYRLFAFEPGLRFPARRLHFVPIPREIPRALWVKTTLRIQHLASLTPERRAARFEKYRQADPNHRYQHNYRDLLSDEGTVDTWVPRNPGQPVLLLGEDVELESPDHPALSAIVIAQNNEATIERTVGSVVCQQCMWPFEVIVVTSGSDRTAGIVRSKFPRVTLIELSKPVLPGEARNVGLKAARGDIISFPGSHVELPPGSLEARIRAHDLGYAMVTGSTLNGTTTNAGWASYFLDHSAVLPGRPSTELKGAPSHCSYTREALVAAGGFPEDMRTGEDTVVNQRIAARGLVAYRAQDVTLIHHSPCRTAPKLVRHHFRRGRGFGRILLDQRRERGNLLTRKTFNSLFSKQIQKRLDMTRRHVESWGDADARAHFERVYPLVQAGATAAWLGTWYEILKPELGLRKALLLRGKPVYTVLVAGLDRWSGKKIGGRADVLMLVRFDLISHRIRILSIPRDLQATIPGHGVSRINGAFQIGAWRDTNDRDAGARLLVETVRKRFEILIDDFVVLDFDGFMELIDAMGGVEVDVPEPIEDTSEWKEDDGTSIGTLKFEAGKQVMDGDRALKYARLRQRDSDTARRARQIRIGLAMLERAKAIRSPVEAINAFRTARRVVQTSVTPVRGLLLLLAAATTPRDQISSARLSPPLLREGKTKTGLFIWKGDDEKIRTFVREKLETRTEAELTTALERSTN